MGTTKENGSEETKDVNDMSLVYSTKDDYDLVQAMGEVCSKITAIEEEIHEEYFAAVNNPDEDALICHLELLEEEYIAFEIQHKARFGIREPNTKILSTFRKEGSKNRNIIVQSVFESILAVDDSG
jgi:hypothetical protein